MTTAEEMKFKCTPDGKPMGIIGDYTPGRQMPLVWEPKHGDDVTVKLDNESISIIDLKILNGHFSGKISGFIESQSNGFRGLKVGQIITFRKDHVWYASI